MAPSNELLARSLKRLGRLQEGGRRVFHSSELSRVHRQRLVNAGFLREVIKGWLVSAGPGSAPGDTTPWYASFWEFCAAYCDRRFGNQWHCSPEQSLLLHAENTVVPTQVVIYSPKANNNAVQLPFGTSLYNLKQPGMPPAGDLDVRNGVTVFRPAAALLRVSPAFFRSHPAEAQVVLHAVRDASEVLGPLLAQGRSTVAGRTAGAMRRAGRADLADEILTAMRAAGHDVRERDPFAAEQTMITMRRGTPPVSARLAALWSQLRGEVLRRMPAPPGLPANKAAYLDSVQQRYEQDAYHSLSIEGYVVTPTLIARVRAGDWRPEVEPDDRRARDALAARGYWEAFQRVRADVGRIIDGTEPGALVRTTHRGWYRALFAPSVSAGLVRAQALAGYRAQPVYIRGSRHVPARWQSVPDAMDTLFDLLTAEPEPAVRAVLGHWMMGYIHPYPDGNGRLARFLMNTMLAAGGWRWTVIRLSDRPRYMRALETASVGREIGPFADLVADRLASERSPAPGRGEVG